MFNAYIKHNLIINGHIYKPVFSKDLIYASLSLHQDWI
jgi:hypothetical protein